MVTVLAEERAANVGYRNTGPIPVCHAQLPCLQLVTLSFEIVRDNVAWAVVYLNLYYFHGFRDIGISSESHQK